MTVYLFPGQGSQRRGMGGSLFDKFPGLVKLADAVLGFSVKELCLTNPHDLLSDTKFAQPALYVVNALSYINRIEEIGRVPDYVAGHSLGEYNALLAAEVFNFETGILLVKKRAELMSEVGGGGMAAVIGASTREVIKILEDKGLSGLDIASENAKNQVVISGLRRDIEFAEDCFRNIEGIECIPLRVSGPFHSRYMSLIAKQLHEYMKDLPFSDPKIPVIANVTARPYGLKECVRNLTDQMTQPVQWEATIRYLLTTGDTVFEEIGPGSVLTNLVQSIRTDIRRTQRIKPNREASRQSQMEIMENDGASYRVGGKSSGGYIDRPGWIDELSLGDREFRQDYNLKYAYVTGSMYRGIASEQLVIRVGRAGMLGFFGTGGLSLQRIETAIQAIQAELDPAHAYGMNLLHQPDSPNMEEQLVDLYLRYQVRNIEASAYINLSSALVRFRAKGLVRGADGPVVIANKILAKVSRPEVAEVFLSPAPARLVDRLVRDNLITEVEAKLLEEVPMADDICVEADSGGHTDQGITSVLLPTMMRLRDRMMKKYRYARRIRMGAAGGIGTPEAAAAAFLYGADFIMTGSINQCTIEAGTSNTVKHLLQQANVQDTDHVPAGDMFEMGSRVQVLKKGLFFPSRAKKLYELYQRYSSLDEIDDKTREMIEQKYFGRSFAEVYEELKSRYSTWDMEQMEIHPKRKMAHVFKWYFSESSRWALEGNPNRSMDYQIHSGPALGAFNQWVKGTEWEDWRWRHVDEIGVKLMHDTAEYLMLRFKDLVQT